jgi:hypothetical protein
MSIAYGGDKITFSDGSTVGNGWSGFKNRIINGDCRIDQRNAGASVTIPAGVSTYALDRFYGFSSQASKFSVQQDAGAVTPPVGFTDYLGVTSLSAYTVGSSEAFLIGQAIEGFNIADLGWGTANAQPVTLSFWVRSSLTGTFGGALRNLSSARSYVFSYSISAANTWEQKSITITGDTTGTWVTNNGVGIQLTFSLGMGSSLSTTAGSWQAGNLLSATGATSVVGTNGATFYITGVQLEKGSTATSFDYLPYTTELALCQRYYYQHIRGSNTTVGNGAYYNSSTVICSLFFPVTMRSSPTLIASTGTDYYTIFRQDAADPFNSFSFNEPSPTGVNIRNTTEVTGTSGVAGLIVAGNASSSVAFQAEL